MSAGEIAQQIETLAHELGFDVIGFCHPQNHPEWRIALEEYHAGDMSYMKNNMDKRSDPSKIWEPVKTIIVLGMNYYHRPTPVEKTRGAFSLYAYGADYHEILKKQLKIMAAEIERRWGASSRVFCDTAPVMEKQLARIAAIGWQSKNAVICSRKLGNCFFLGEVFTDMSIDFPKTAPCPDSCGTCRRCLDICPTKALERPYIINVPRCIAYLTIEHKGLIPEELRPLIGNRIYGCDACLQICPWNKFARETSQKDFAARNYLNLPLGDYLEMDEKAFRQTFRQTAIKRIGRTRFIRNVLIAIGNSAEKAYLPKLEKFVNDDNEVISLTALWAQKRLEKA